MSQRTWSFSKHEFLLIISLCFGYSIIGSIQYFFSSPIKATITNDHLLWLVCYEPIALVISYVILKSRNFDFEALTRFRKSIGNNLKNGLFLWLITYLSYYLMFYATSIISPDTIQYVEENKLVAGNLSLSLIILVSLINPFFEESILLGYIVTSLRSSTSQNLCINISVAIRLSYHLYQGPLVAISLLPLGLIFTYWYYKNNNIWPVVIAHGIHDFIGLAFHQ